MLGTKKQLERIHEVKIMGPQWDRSCGSKHRFSTKAEADRAVYRVLCGTGDVVKSYKCAFGNHYHIGHPIGTKNG